MSGRENLAIFTEGEPSTAGRPRKLGGNSERRKNRLYGKNEAEEKTGGG